MANFFSNYSKNKRLEKASILYTLAVYIMINPEKGVSALQESYPEIIDKIIKKNTLKSSNLIEGISSRFILKVKSLVTKFIPVEEGWNQGLGFYIAFEIFKEVILIYPENLRSWWKIIGILHRERRNDEAFSYYLKMPNQKINEDDMDVTWEVPIILGMLISVKKNKEAHDVLDDVLYKFFKNKNDSPKKLFFLRSLAWEINFLSKESIKDYIKLIRSIDKLIIPIIIKEIIVKVYVFINEENLNEALSWVNMGLEYDSNNRDCLNIKKEIEKDLKEGNAWDSMKSAEDFFRYLYRRLVHRFHPDLSKNDNERIEKTKIMSEINRAKSSNNLEELKKITQNHAPDWVKYFRF